MWRQALARRVYRTTAVRGSGGRGASGRAVGTVRGPRPPPHIQSLDAEPNEHYARAGLERIQHFVATGDVSSGQEQGGEATAAAFVGDAAPPLLSLVQIRRQDLDPAAAPAAFLLHGAISNGRVFHSHKASGLAPFLARHGFNVFVGELRGRGAGVPTLAQEAASTGRPVAHGQFESIRQDVPRMSDAVCALSRQPRQAWLGHSWGGVVMSSALAFDHSLADRVTSMVFFGTKKEIHDRREWTFVSRVGIPWTLLAPLLARWFGFFDASRLLPGGATDGETLGSLRDCNAWVYSDDWTDPQDGFDYHEAYHALLAARGGAPSSTATTTTPPATTMPPAFHVAGVADDILGRPADVQRFAALTQQTQRFALLSRAGGNLRDYGHGDMLTSRDAERDHFPVVLDFCWEHCGVPRDGTAAVSDLEPPPAPPPPHSVS